MTAPAGWPDADGITRARSGFDNATTSAWAAPDAPRRCRGPELPGRCALSSRPLSRFASGQPIFLEDLSKESAGDSPTPPCLDDGGSFAPPQWAYPPSGQATRDRAPRRDAGQSSSDGVEDATRSVAPPTIAKRQKGPVASTGPCPTEVVGHGGPRRAGGGPPLENHARPGSGRAEREPRPACPQHAPPRAKSLPGARRQRPPPAGVSFSHTISSHARPRLFR